MWAPRQRTAIIHALVQGYSFPASRVRLEFRRSKWRQTFCGKGAGRPTGAGDRPGCLLSRSIALREQCSQLCEHKHPEVVPCGRLKALLDSISAWTSNLEWVTHDD